ncbi:MFS transporter [Allostella vacuolata]|nr:MFS transporter [Stella vacuolata]
MTEQHASQAWTGWVLMAAVAAIGSNSLVLSPLLGDVAASLATDPVAVSRAIAAYGGMTALSALLSGPQIDRFGQRRALLAGLVLLADGMALSAAAPGWIALAGGQAVAGLGAGIALPAIYGLATLTAAPGRESRALGRVLTGWSVAMVAGVPAAAAIADRFGWRSVFVLLAGVMAAALIGCCRLPAVRPAEPRRPAAPLLAPLRLPAVGRLLLVCLAFMGAFYGTYAFFGAHVRQALGLSAGEAGILVAAYGLGFAAAGLGDRWIDRLGARRLHPAVLLATAGIYALMVPAPAGIPAAAALAGAWGLANHFGLNILVLRLAAAAPQARGAVLGLNSAVTYLAVLLGVAGAGWVHPAIGFSGIAAAAALLSAMAAAIALGGRTGQMTAIGTAQEDGTWRTNASPLPAPAAPSCRPGSTGRPARPGPMSCSPTASPAPRTAWPPRASPPG